MRRMIEAFGRAWLSGVLLCLTAATATAQQDVIGRWSAYPALPYFPVHIHLLPNGKVMIWPGNGKSGDDPRLWDPTTGSVSTLARSGFDLFCTGHSFLADGRLLVAGGNITTSVGLPNASIYSPFSNSWTALPNMNAGRWYPTNTTLANGDVLVVSGDVDTSVGVNRLPQVFQVATGQWRDLTNAQLSMDLYPRMYLAPNGKVFNPAPSVDTRYLDTSGSGAWSYVAGRGVYRDYGSSALYADGKVLIMGGGDPPTNTAEVIDLNAAVPAWRPVAAMAYARRHLNATLLPDGKVLVNGGTSGSGFNNTTTPVYAAELWDPATETWTTLASEQVQRWYHSAALLLLDGRVLATGGDDTLDVEVYEPPYLFKGSRPMITSAPASVAYGQNFVVQTPDATSVTNVTWLRLSSVTHAFNMNQRINRLVFSQVTGGVNVVAPSNPNLALPGHYMLFILNGSGIPSVAKVIQLTGTAPPPPPPPTLNPVPKLSALTPSSTTAGSGAFNLTVTGANFIPNSVILWKGAQRPTSFINTGQLQALISASDVAKQGTMQVTVVNPAPGGGTSNSLNFSIRK